MIFHGIFQLAISELPEGSSDATAISMEKIHNKNFETAARTCNLLNQLLQSCYIFLETTHWSSLIYIICMLINAQVHA